MLVESDSLLTAQKLIAIPSKDSFDPECGYHPSKGYVAIVTNPYQPLRGVQRFVIEYDPIEGVPTIQDFLDAKGITFHLPTVCFRNGTPLMQDEWDYMPIEPGDLVVFSAIPMGDDSNPLAIVAMIVIAAIAGPFGQWFAGTSIGSSMVTAGLTAEMVAGIAAGVFAFVGTALVAALFPPPMPTSNLNNQSLAAPSPTYNLAAQGNQARLGAAIPVQYGYHICYPDFGAQPYVEYAGNEQYLYQLFILGQGHYDIHGMYLEDTPLGNFEEVQTEIIPPGGTVTLFPTNVITSSEVSGQELTQNVVIGPFVAVPQGQLANGLAVDLVAPRGLFQILPQYPVPLNMSITFLIEYQQINNTGTPIGSWQTFANPTLNAATLTPQRYSYRIDSLTPGRYQVRITRQTGLGVGTTNGDQLLWSGLRSYLPGTQQYGSVTAIAIRMRATNQLSGLSSRKFNVLATRKLKTWSTAGGWTAEVATKNPAWAFVDLLKNADYGLGLADSRIDLKQMEYLASVWATRGDEFNGIFDSAIGSWEALTVIARSGRAYPIRLGGVVTCIRDAPQTVPSAMFTSRNIVKNSFSLQYLTPTADMADAVEVEYFEKDKWVWERVVCALPGSTAEKPVRLPQLIGITIRDQAYKEGLFVAACNKYRRKLATFRTEMEGQIALPGNLILISFDLLSQSTSGEILAHSPLSPSGVLGSNATLTLSNEVSFGVGDHYIAFRVYDGTVAGPFRCVAGGSADQVVLPDGANFHPQIDLSLGERTFFAFGTLTTYVQQFKVINIRPQQQQVEITCVNEDATVHTVETGGVTPPVTPPFELPPVPIGPVIPQGSLYITQGGTADAPTAILNWQPAPGATYYLVEQSVDNASWTNVGSPTNNALEVRAYIGTNYFRVAGVGEIQGPWATGSIVVAGSTAPDNQPPPTLTGLIAVASINSIYLTWEDPDFTHGASIEVWRSNDANIANASILSTHLYPTYMVVDELGSQGITKYYWVRIVNTNGVPGSFTGPVSAITGGADFTEGTSNNIVLNPEFRIGLDYWYGSVLENPAGYAGWSFARNLAGWTLSGTGTAYIYQPNAVAQDAYHYPSQNSSNPRYTDACRGGQYLEAHFEVATHRCTAAVCFRFYDASNVLIQQQIASAATGRLTSAEGKTGGTLLSAYKRIYHIVQAPSNAAYFSAGIYKYGTDAGQTNSYAFFTRVFVGTARAEQTFPSVYGANTGAAVPTGWLAGQITETQIQDGAIKSPKIAANQIAAGHIAANTIGASHILANNITGDHIAANSITAAKGQIADLAVSTLKIQNRAVTVPTSYSSQFWTWTSYVSLGYITNPYWQFLSFFDVYVDCTGQPVFIWANVDNANIYANPGGFPPGAAQDLYATFGVETDAYFEVRRDGNIIAQRPWPKYQWNDGINNRYNTSKLNWLVPILDLGAAAGSRLYQVGAQVLVSNNLFIPTRSWGMISSGRLGMWLEVKR